MNKTCARCEKTVYPTEELKCLDKVWHKGCFKCQECGMTLNMRTYKGYGKLPYCEAHVPKAKHTTMAETPELKRIAENTKIQSNVVYHADFEKSKGKFTQVADDPETLRIKANTRIISNVAYHGDLEKKAQMEKQRQINENGELVDVQTDYHQQIDNYATEMLPPPNLPPRNNYSTQQYPQNTQYTPNHNMHAQITHQSAPHQSLTHQNIPQAHQNVPPTHQNLQHQVASHPNPGHQNVTHQVTSHPNAPHQSVTHNVTSHPNPAHQNVTHNVTSHPAHHNVTNYQQQRYQDQYYKAPKDDYAYQYQEFQNQQKIGRIQDYDPLSDGPRQVPNTQRASATLIYNSTNDKRGAHQSSQSLSQPRQIGRVTDMDPLAGGAGGAGDHHPPRSAHHQPAPAHNQKVYIAMYDYDSNDTDEVSFREGDLISNVSSIDEGWMTGQVLRTGHSGMLPANYVAECPPQQLNQY